MVNGPDSNWFRLICSLWEDVDSEVLRKFFSNFIINANFYGWDIQEKARQKYGCNIPWAILMDPTSACNLHCTGCWAAEYGNKLNLSLDELDSVICQGKELGTYMYIYSGGEPLVRKDDIIRLCEKHDDCVFLAFTNATLIDKAFADEMLRVKNFVPAISVEGFEEDTDFRRGEGTFGKVMRAMEILRRKKLPFGVSCCYTGKNVETIGSEKYFDDMIAWGAKFAWFFTYMPVGVDAVPELLASAEQREVHVSSSIRAFRKTKPLFTMDFWNDGEYGGRLHRGRQKLPVTSTPTATLSPARSSTIPIPTCAKKRCWRRCKARCSWPIAPTSPSTRNLLRPCPVLDNPGRLTQMVESSGANSTDLMHPEDVRALSDKCVPVAKRWAPVADELWRCSHDCGGCSGCGK